MRDARGFGWIGLRGAYSHGRVKTSSKKEKDMVQIRKASEGFLHSGATHSIPNKSPSPSGSIPQNILYLKVHYFLNGDGTLSSTYYFDEESGTYPIGNGIAAFIDEIRDDNVDPSNRLEALPDDDDPSIQYPCYVVFAVDMAGPVEVRPDSAVLTDNTSDDYFNLVVAPDYPDEPISYHIAYFRAMSPSHNSVDWFNIFTSLPGEPAIDPAIKNTGHTIGKGHHDSPTS